MIYARQIKNAAANMMRSGRATVVFHSAARALDSEKSDLSIS